MSAIVLSRDDAAALLRWLEYLMDGQRFYNPIVAGETQRAAVAAKERLRAKLESRPARQAEDAVARDVE